MKQHLIALSTILALPGLATAATNGALSETESQGTFKIILAVTEAQQIQVTDLEDAEFDLKSNQAPTEQTLTPCIYMSGPVNEYDLKLDGDVLTDQFTQYKYSVTFQSFDNGNMDAELVLNVDGTEESVERSAIPASSSATCNGARTTKILVNLNETLPLAATNGDAEATITITVSPTA